MAWQAGWLTSRVMITYLASHRLFLNIIFGGNKIQNGQIACYTSLWQALWDSSRKQTGFHKMVQWWFNASYVFYWLIPSLSLWCCEYNRFLVYTRGQKSWSDRTSCLFGFSWGANPLPSCIWYHLYVAAGLEIQSHKVFHIELSKVTCHSHFGQHGLSRFMRSRDPCFISLSL